MSQSTYFGTPNRDRSRLACVFSMNVLLMINFSLQVLLQVRERVLQEALSNETLTNLDVQRQFIANYLGLRLRDTCSSSLLGVIQASDLERTTMTSVSRNLSCEPGLLAEMRANPPLFHCSRSSLERRDGRNFATLYRQRELVTSATGRQAANSIVAVTIRTFSERFRR